MADETSGAITPNPASPPPPPPPPAPEPGTPPNSVAKGADLPGDGTSVAKGDSTSSLGDQIHPSTQTREDDGNRTLANPTLDPGPYVKPGALEIKNPDRSKGEHRYSDANEPVSVMMRTSTGHDKGYGQSDGSTVDQRELPPDMFISGAASDDYHPKGGASLTEQAAQNAAAQRELAPARDPGGDKAAADEATGRAIVGADAPKE